MRQVLQFECVAGAIFNAFASGGIAWLMFWREIRVPLWGWPGVITDFLPGTIVPAVLMTLLLGAGWTRRARLGKAFAIADDQGHWLLQRLAMSPVPLRVIAIAITACLVFLPLVVGLIAASASFYGIVSMTLPAVILLKMSYGGLLGSLMSPVVVFVSVLAVNDLQTAATIKNPMPKVSDEP